MGRVVGRGKQGGVVRGMEKRAEEGKKPFFDS